MVAVAPLLSDDELIARLNALPKNVRGSAAK